MGAEPSWRPSCLVEWKNSEVVFRRIWELLGPGSTPPTTRRLLTVRTKVQTSSTSRSSRRATGWHGGCCWSSDTGGGPGSDNGEPAASHHSLFTHLPPLHALRASQHWASPNQPRQPGAWARKPPTPIRPRLSHSQLWALQQPTTVLSGQPCPAAAPTWKLRSFWKPKMRNYV